MTSQTATPDRPTALPPDTPDDVLAGVAETFLDAMLSSADVSVIGVSSWWDRATSALETGCAVGDGVRAVTARVAKKLQVGVLSRETAAVVDRVAVQLTDPAVFARWRYLAARDAVYVAAMVRLRRDERSAQYKARSTKQAKPAAPPTDDTLLPAF